MDRGSRNGTYVDGERVEGVLEVNSGAEITISAARLVVVVRAPSSEEDRDPTESNETRRVANDPAMLRTLALAERAALTDTTILLVGETGVGKEVVARWVHGLSSRREGPMVTVNCGTVDGALAESALFGHERGAFTGASNLHRGFFEQAHGGTLLLDEVGELSSSTQVRLLRVL